MFVVAYYNCLTCLVLIQQHKTFLPTIHRKVSPVTLKIPLLNNNDYEPNVTKNMNSLFIDHNLSAITKLYVPPHDPSKWQFLQCCHGNPFICHCLVPVSVRQLSRANIFMQGKFSLLFGNWKKTIQFSLNSSHLIRKPHLYRHFLFPVSVCVNGVWLYVKIQRKNLCSSQHSWILTVVLEARTY